VSCSYTPLHHSTGNYLYFLFLSTSISSYFLSPHSLFSLFLVILSSHSIPSFFFSPSPFTFTQLLNIVFFHLIFFFIIKCTPSHGTLLSNSLSITLEAIIQSLPVSRHLFARIFHKPSNPSLSSTPINLN
jgi:hypothetical protein